MKTPFFLYDAQAFNARIYGSRNAAGYTLTQLAAKLYIRLAFVSKAVRTGNPDRIKGSLAVAFSWLCAIANRLGVDLHDATWGHYPFCCPYCVDLPCHCYKLTERPKTRAILPGHVIPEQTRNTVKDFQEMFKLIYRQNTLDGSIGHLMEEHGELTEQLDLLSREGRSEKRFAKVSEELVDVLANLFAVANGCGISLSDCYQKAFQDGCCTCKKTLCACEIITEENPRSVV